VKFDTEATASRLKDSRNKAATITQLGTPVVFKTLELEI
jgi:hypothetical protein